MIVTGPRAAELLAEIEAAVVAKPLPPQTKSGPPAKVA
jgi:hypothetical protein